MNESPSPSNPPPPPTIVRRKGLGCVPTGCIILVVLLMLLGVGFGSMMWLFSQGGMAYTGDHSALNRPEPTQAEYESALGKLAPFAQAMNEGRAATVEITPADFNALIARSPQLQFWRGKLFLEAKDDHLSADVSMPVTNDDKHPKYFNGRATFDASYASNGFAFYLRHLAPLDQTQGDTRFSRFLNHPSMLQAISQQISRDINEDLRQQARQDPATADLLRKLRTAVVQEGKIVLTTGDVGTTVPDAPPATPESSPQVPEASPTPGSGTP